MSAIDQALVDEFKAKAVTIAATVVEVANMDEAMQYIADVSVKKAPCELLADEPTAEQGPLGPNKVPTRVKRIVAAPKLDDENFAKLNELCAPSNIACIREGLRNHLAGIDVGVSFAMLGIAESATCLMNTNDEEDRLAGMISEISMIVLKKSDIRPNLDSIADFVCEYMDQDAPTYTTFITGPSRTADIERVGAIGVHGPLELHIILLED